MQLIHVHVCTWSRYFGIISSTSSAACDDTSDGLTIAQFPVSKVHVV